MDRITVSGIQAFGFHGAFEHERDLGQPFLVDVELGVELREAGATDKLEATIDYGQVVDDVVQLLEGQPVTLIERLAELIAERCLANPRVRHVRVCVHKPHAPVRAVVDDISVTVERSRR